MIDFMLFAMMATFGFAVLAAVALASRWFLRRLGFDKPVWAFAIGCLAALPATIWYVGLDRREAFRQAFPRGGILLRVTVDHNAPAHATQAVLDDLTPILLASSTVRSRARYRIRGRVVEVVLGEGAHQSRQYSHDVVPTARLRRLFDALLSDDAAPHGDLRVRLVPDDGEPVSGLLRIDTFRLDRERVPAPEGRYGQVEACILDATLDLAPEAAQSILQWRPPTRERRPTLHLVDPPPDIGQPEYPVLNWRLSSLPNSDRAGQPRARLPVRLELSQSRFSIDDCDSDRYQNGLHPFWLHATARRDYPAIVRYAARADVSVSGSSRWYSRAGWIQMPAIGFEQVRADAPDR